MGYVKLKARNCKNCKQLIVPYHVGNGIWRRIKFCSIACRDVYLKLHPKESTVFKDGHVGVITSPWLGKQLTESHKYNISEAMQRSRMVQQHLIALGKTKRQSNHWNWKGGITESNRLIRHSVEYNTWRKAVYARDRWTCQDCHQRQKRIVAHHILSFEEYPELRFEVSNGVTLCRACHNCRHRDIKQFFDIVQSERFATMMNWIH